MEFAFAGMIIFLIAFEYYEDTRIGAKPKRLNKRAYKFEENISQAPL
jgi:hypothetical protein